MINNNPLNKIYSLTKLNNNNNNNLMIISNIPTNDLILFKLLPICNKSNSLINIQSDLYKDNASTHTHSDDIDNYNYCPQNGGNIHEALTHAHNSKDETYFKQKRYIIKYSTKYIIRHKSKYIKFNQNQLQILDALLYDGSYKKYIDSKGNLRYSEHSGLFDFENGKLDRFIISGKTFREDRDDIDILLPKNMPDAFDYEYIFHTHPPTPYPGARAIHGILYEFPSISDLYHFAYHYNEGNVQGSMIIAPEGIYIIKMKENIKYIDYPNNKIAKKMEKSILNIQKKAISKYGTNFKLYNQTIFFEKVITDFLYIKLFNKIITKYFNSKLIVLYKPRTYDKLTNKWIIKKLYIKIDPIEIEFS